MSFLTEHPDVMMEVIAVLVRRAGGSVIITAEEAPGPFNVWSKFGDDGKLYLSLDESVTTEDVDRLQAEEASFKELYERAH